MCVLDKEATQHGKCETCFFTDTCKDRKYQVVSSELAKVGIIEIKFQGTEEECLEYMKTHSDVDLIYQGRFRSWFIK